MIRAENVERISRNRYVSIFSFTVYRESHNSWTFKKREHLLGPQFDTSIRNIICKKTEINLRINLRIIELQRREKQFSFSCKQRKSKQRATTCVASGSISSSKQFRLVINQSYTGGCIIDIFYILHKKISYKMLRYVLHVPAHVIILDSHNDS